MINGARRWIGAREEQENIESVQTFAQLWNDPQSRARLIEGSHTIVIDFHEEGGGDVGEGP